MHLQQTYAKGFLLAELLIALVIIGLLGTVMIPNFQRQQKGYERKQFIEQLNAITLNGWKNALLTGKQHRVVFDITNKKIQLEQQQTTADKQSFVLSSNYTLNTIAIPKTITCTNFYIGDKDEMASYQFGSATQLWFFIMPDGLTQQIRINCVDTAERKHLSFSLVLNPFTAQFT